ncbi:S9 family peptidase [Streptomyces sp. NBC_00690]|uniref:S9 family peptidase n=1 Tax=Streptomyces sp. NBC_00690 TaxID=2975808 RepID=UPI002E29014C|nr:alpha/beta fold hydrolase [Streptomyces sp. NBC_00690]
MTMRKLLSFPRQNARTQRYTLGAPRTFTISPDGARVVFIRSSSGTDRCGQLWVVDLAIDPADEGIRLRERLAADPGVLLDSGEEQLSAQERARRERGREGGSGIVAYAVDEAVELAAFSLSGRLFCTELPVGTVRELPALEGVVDPRPSPDGRHIAYVSQRSLRVVEAGGDGDRTLVEPEDEYISYGAAEFIAAEEMGRSRGFWWSPESDRLLVARVDESKVQRWWISDPSHPERAPEPVAYPAAGTSNAEVRLFLVTLDGEQMEIGWDRIQFPYLARVHWSKGGAPILLVQSRDQRIQHYLAVNADNGSTRTIQSDEDSVWLDLFPGVPAWGPGGALVRIVDEGGARVLAVGDRVWTDSSLHLRAVLDIGTDDVLVLASAGETAADPELGELHVHRVTEQGVERISHGPGVHSAVRTGAVTVLATARLDVSGTLFTVLREGEELGPVATRAEQPVLTTRPRLCEAGVRRIPCAVLLPQEYQESDGPLPVLVDPYGGPHGQRVYAAHNSHLTSQWFANQGFAVIVADGRGTPGRSPAREKAIKDDFPLTLDDQVDALHWLAEQYPLDLGRVGIRGWSYGGYLAALAVLRRPDVFHAAIAGAPGTDFSLYDTHYTERYLGDPNARPTVYASNSLVTQDGLTAPKDPARPLMIIHGLADDNVVAAHSLRLSSALLAAGREHEVLPLSGVTHMTPQEEIAENLLLLQVDFLKRRLG